MALYLNVVKIQSILAEQDNAGRPSAAICAAIASMKDLCDIGGAGNVDWRRGGLSTRGGMRQTAFRSSPSLQTLSSGNSSPTSGSYSPARYKSKFQNANQGVDVTILNNIILSKLNKFSGTTYTDVRDFLYQILGSGDDITEMVRQFMLMVFKKAATEEIYCALYAKLLAEISARYTVISEEMQKLQENYLEIFDDVEEVKEGQDNYEVFVEKNKNKRYRLGYSQFLAELAAIEFLDLSNLERTFQKLMDLLLKYAAVPDRKVLVEEYTDCLVRMSRVLKKKSSIFFIAARKSLLAISKETIDTLIAKKEDYPSLSPKARFLLMDVRDNMA
jgi:hypothetical protein